MDDLSLEQTLCLSDSTFLWMPSFNLFLVVHSHSAQQETLADNM